ncbi:ead/Ea22-like family protein [Cronobacter dublinensis subsp. infanticibi]|uniref:ead/Ea22-like family protein n=1 Tax=Cronobacter dublinensis TaxID=413497 RepID=UPI0023DD4BAF|nr:ead/Ea22-like family protein [Cronobacter dublinensis]WEP47182.1 ead/Ea22-like family protein [Cronobacter dublinensis]
MTDTAKLKAAALAATPGSWRYQKTTPVTDAEISAENHTRVVNLLAGDVTPANSEFIALANPTAVLELIAALEARNAQIAEQDKRLIDYAAIATKGASRVAELEKKAAFLKEKLSQLANFNPDWDMLEAATDSLREHMAELTAANKRIAELEARKLEVITPPRLCHEYAAVAVQQRDEQWYKALHDACDRAGINLETGGE